MIFCNQCGSTVEDGEQFCTECGARVVAMTASQSPTIASVGSHAAQSPANQPIYTTAPLSSATASAKKPTNPIIWVAIPFGLLVIVILTVIGFSVSSSNNNSKGPTISGSVTNSPPRADTIPGLPVSFQRNYQGNIGSKSAMSFAMTLTRSGRDLNGTASSGLKTDALAGTIETDGRFRLEGYENGTTLTGIYTGQIYTDGTVSGTWVTAAGQKETPFSLRQQ